MKKTLVIVLTAFAFLFSSCTNTVPPTKEISDIEHTSEDVINASPANEQIYQVDDNEKNTVQSDSQNSKTCIKTYTHAALEGAVIIKSDSSTGEVKYKKKCEKCGNVDSSTTSTYIKSSTMNSSHYCSKCKTNQKIRIQGTMDVKWE